VRKYLSEGANSWTQRVEKFLSDPMQLPKKLGTKIEAAVDHLGTRFGESRLGGITNKIGNKIGTAYENFANSRFGGRVTKAASEALEGMGNSAFAEKIVTMVDRAGNRITATMEEARVLAGKGFEVFSKKLTDGAMAVDKFAFKANAAKTAAGEAISGAVKTARAPIDAFIAKARAPVDAVTARAVSALQGQATRLIGQADDAFKIAAQLSERAEQASVALGKAEQLALKVGESGGAALERVTNAVKGLRSLVSRTTTEAAEAGVMAAEASKTAFVGGEAARNAIQLAFARVNEKTLQGAAELAAKFAQASGSAESIVMAEQLAGRASQVAQTVNELASGAKTFGTLAGEGAAKSGLATAGHIAGTALMIAFGAHSAVETSKTLIGLNEDLKQGKWDARKYEDAWLGSTHLHLC